MAPGVSSRHGNMVTRRRRGGVTSFLCVYNQSEGPGTQGDAGVALRRVKEVSWVLWTDSKSRSFYDARKYTSLCLLVVPLNVGPLVANGCLERR